MKDNMVEKLAVYTLCLNVYFVNHPSNEVKHLLNIINPNDI